MYEWVERVHTLAAWKRLCDGKASGPTGPDAHRTWAPQRVKPERKVNQAILELVGTRARGRECISCHSSFSLPHSTQHSLSFSKFVMFVFVEVIQLFSKCLLDVGH